MCKKADFGETVNKLWRNAKDLDCINDDMAAFGAPGECYSSSCHVYEKKFDRTLKESGWEFDELINMMEERTTPRWAFEFRCFVGV